MFVANHSNEYQLSFLDKNNFLTEREKRFLNQSWAKYFAESIFPKIDEEPYAVLYSEQSSRPNTPVNVILGALLIKELAGLSDEDMVTGLMFDIRYQYALHTTSFTEQPLSDRTLGRFRARCTAYETKTGTDLIKNTVTPTIQRTRRNDEDRHVPETDGQHDGRIKHQENGKTRTVIYLCR